MERPWLDEMYEDLSYRWLIKNVVMRNDEHGVELTYRYRRSTDVICGARKMHAPIEGYQDYSWRPDRTVEHEVVCILVGDHGEAPHIGVPAPCADMTCECSKYGCGHLVMVRFAINQPGVSDVRPSYR